MDLKTFDNYLKKAGSSITEVLEEVDRQDKKMKGLDHGSTLVGHDKFNHAIANTSSPLEVLDFAFFHHVSLKGKEYWKDVMTKLSKVYGDDLATELREKREKTENDENLKNLKGILEASIGQDLLREYGKALSLTSVGDSERNYAKELFVTHIKSTYTPMELNYIYENDYEAELYSLMNHIYYADYK